MVWREKVEAWFRFVGGFEACMGLTWGNMKRLWYLLVCTSYKLVLIPCIDLQQPKVLNLSVAEFSFCHFGQKIIFAQGIGFYVLWGLGLRVDLQSHHNIIWKVFVNHWDHKEIFWALGALIFKIWLRHVWFVHHGKSANLDQGQIKLTREFCHNFWPLVPCYDLDWMQKEQGQKGLWFRDGNVSN